MATGALSTVQPFLDDNGERLRAEGALELAHSALKAALQTMALAPIGDHHDDRHRHGLRDQPAPDTARYPAADRLPNGNEPVQPRGITLGHLTFSFLK
jgi:hypothetical protein